MELRAGQKATWSSQAGGHWKTKTGTLVAIVPPHRSAYRYLPAKLPRSRRKFDVNYSEIERAVVEVPRDDGSGITDFYAPRLSQLRPAEKQE